VAGAALARDLDAHLMKRGSDRLTRALAGRLDRITVGHRADPDLLILPSLDAHCHIALPREGLKEIEDEYPWSFAHALTIRCFDRSSWELARR
jgi:hypothetical protein